MNQIKPNDDGTCSEDCPQYTKTDYMEAECAAQISGVTDWGETLHACVEEPDWFIGICPIAYQRLLELARASALLRKRLGDITVNVDILGFDAINRWNMAYDAVRDLVGEDDE